MEIFNNVNSIFKLILGEKLKEASVAVDATVGNGNDTEELLKKVGKNGFVYGFDIQQIAIDKTEKRLKEKVYGKNYRLICDGHEKIDKYIDENIDFAVFNLGYLPKADHSVITKANTSIRAIEKISERLNEAGTIVISAYLGHEGGMEEYQSILKYCKGIDQKKFNVASFQFLNQVNNPPRMIIIEKRKEKIKKQSILNKK